MQKMTQLMIRIVCMVLQRTERNGLSSNALVSRLRQFPPLCHSHLERPKFSVLHGMGMKSRSDQRAWMMFLGTLLGYWIGNADQRTKSIQQSLVSKSFYFIFW